MNFSFSDRPFEFIYLRARWWIGARAGGYAGRHFCDPVTMHSSSDRRGFVFISSSKYMAMPTILSQRNTCRRGDAQGNFIYTCHRGDVGTNPKVARNVSPRRHLNLRLREQSRPGGPPIPAEGVEAAGASTHRTLGSIATDTRPGSGRGGESTIRRNDLRGLAQAADSGGLRRRYGQATS